MKTVLIVDDEILFLASLTEGLQDYSDEFAVVTAANGREAVKILQAQEITLVITDLKMPVMDGFQLLAHMVQAHPQIPVIVMTAFGTPEIEDCIANFDACGYMEKPIDFQLLTDKIRAITSDSASQGMHGINLRSFLQLLHSERKTCALKISSGNNRGTLDFFEGEMVDALFENSVGESAALEIIGWSDASIEVVKAFKKTECRIEKPLLEILLASARRDGQTTSPNGKSQTANAVAAVSETPNNRQTKNQQSSEKDNSLKMTNLNESISELMSLDGAIAVALVDTNSGMALGTAGNTINMDVAAAGNSEVVKSKMKVMSNLGLKDKIEDILITLGNQYHLIRPLVTHQNLFFYVVLDRTKSNLAMARFKLSDVEARVEV